MSNNIFSQRVLGIKDSIEKSDTKGLVYLNQTITERINKGSSNVGILEKRIEEDKIEIIELNEVKKLLVRLKNAKVIEKKEFILSTINLALADVFPDQNITIDIVAAATNESAASQINLKYDVVLKQNGVEMAKNEKLINNGGGILAFISLLFKVLVGYIHSKNKFYIFDESLAEVSVVYLPRLAKFLKKFCEKHQFTLVMVTHEVEILSKEAHLTYRVEGEEKDGLMTLKIDKVEGDVPEKNYIYADITNFQSIKNIKFKYYGLTLITGPNNIGKSASFRAVNSLLFNSFDTKAYPRMSSIETPDKRLNTVISFGWVGEDGKEDPVRKVTLKKKGQGIVYEFDNKEFVGKMLAFDKVKEKIESIGFSYLNLKDSYKNFKGNMKEQTERLAVTNQQDGYYIVGAKTSETSKIFDFLFDSRDATLAIASVSDDIQVINRRIEETNLQISSFKNDLKLDTVLQKLIVKWYNIKLIYEIDGLSNEANFIKMSLDIHTKRKELLDTGVHLINTMDLIQVSEHTISHLKEDFEHYTNHKNLYEKIIGVREKVNMISLINTKSSEVFYYDNVFTSTTKRSEILVKLINCYNNSVLAGSTISTGKLFKDLNMKVLSLKRRSTLVTSILNLNWSQAIIETLHTKIDEKETLVRQLSAYQKKSGIITNIINYYRVVDSIRVHIHHRNDKIKWVTEYTQYIKKLNLMNKEFTLKITKHAILNHIGLSDSYKNHIENLKQSNIHYAEQVSNLSTKYNLCECTSCSGLGMVNLK